MQQTIREDHTAAQLLFVAVRGHHSQVAEMEFGGWTVGSWNGYKQRQ